MNLDIINTHRPVTPENIKGLKTMNNITNKAKEEQIIDLYIREYMTEAECHIMYNKVKRSVNNMKRIYKFDNATITVNGEVSKERLEKATIELMKAVKKQKENNK